MKNRIVGFLILLLFTACSGVPIQDEKTAMPIELDSSLLVGCWRMDSSSNCNFSWDELYITQTFDYYVFSRSNGGGLHDHGKIPYRDSIQNQYGTMNELELLDSFTLRKNRTGWVEHQDFYTKWVHENVNEELILAQKKDSLRSLLIGWWKLKKSAFRIDLPNARNGNCETVTMQFKNDGEVVFYKENQLDSTVNYGYQMYPDFVSLSRGCISAYCYAHVDENGDLRFELDRRYQDTLLFERILEIN